MDAPLNERCTLVRAFVEFEMLPDLLARTPPPRIARSHDQPGSRSALSEINEREAIAAWTEFLGETGANMDHVESGDLPAGVQEEAYLAEDAWILAHRLGWLSPVGPTEPGRHLAEIAARPWEERTEDDTKTLVATIAASLRDRYGGAEQVQIVPLLQRGAASLQATEHVWAKRCPGLLFCEFEALIFWAFARGDFALSLCDELVTYRDVAMHAHGAPPDDGDPTALQVLHADATTRLYLETEELTARTGLTVTEVRSTAMLLTFAELMEESLLGPVSYLSTSAD